MSERNRKTLSVIIPTYGQEKTIVENVRDVEKVLKQLRCDYEVIIIIDGSKGNKAFDRLKKIKSLKIQVFAYENNKGKGYAVRFGMAKATGDYVAFIDAGGDLNPNGLSMLLEHMEWYNADIIIGSKLHPVSKVHYPFSRKMLSFFSRTWIWLLFGLKTRDTQTGMKIFKRKVLLKILPRLVVKKFAFDIEILAVSKHLGFKRIFEAPIELDYNFQSTITNRTFLTVLFKTFVDTLAIFYRLYLLRYYDDKNKKNWLTEPDLIFSFLKEEDK